MRRFLRFIFVLALFCGPRCVVLAGAQSSVPAPAAPAPAGMPKVTTEQVNSFMRHTFGWNPDIKWEVQGMAPAEAPNVTEVHVGVTTPQGQEMLVLFVMPDGQYAVTGDMVPFGYDPYGPVRDRLASQAKGASKGPADAGLTIVEFSDLQCPHCKAAQPVIDKLLADFPNARVVFENFPLTSLHDWAFKAAAYSECVRDQSPTAFWKFVQAVFDAQENITVDAADNKLTELATAAGVDGASASRCSAKPDIRARIEQALQLGKEVGVTGTPTLYLNGRRIANVGGTPYNILSALAKFQGEEDKPSGAK